MVPDKIFIDEDLISFHVLQTKHDGDIEYIRKDVLVELLKEKRKSIKECSATKERKVAALSVFDFLIDKIESL